MAKSMQVTGIAELTKKLKRIEYTIKGIPKEDLPQVAEQGMLHAQKIAPKATGALIQAIKFNHYGEIWMIISKQPKKKEYNYPNSMQKQTKPLPYHIWIETGVQPAKTGENAYMKKTAQWLSQVLFYTIDNKIKQAIKS